MRFVIVRSLLLLLFCSGCDSSWRASFPLGTKLYEAPAHRYFGQVVGYENRHDFQNGTDPAPAILIESADGSHARVWGACSTCVDLFEVEKPGGR